MPQLDIDTFLPQLVWLAITFGLLYWLMSSFVLPRVTEVIEARAAAHRGRSRSRRGTEVRGGEARAAFESALADARAQGGGARERRRGGGRARREPAPSTSWPPRLPSASSARGGGRDRQGGRGRQTVAAMAGGGRARDHAPPDRVEVAPAEAASAAAAAMRSVRDGRVACRARVLVVIGFIVMPRSRGNRSAASSRRCSTRAATRSARISSEAARLKGEAQALLDDFKEEARRGGADRRGHRRACPQRGRPHRRRGRPASRGLAPSGASRCDAAHRPGREPGDRRDPRRRGRGRGRRPRKLVARELDDARADALSTPRSPTSSARSPEPERPMLT